MITFLVRPNANMSTVGFGIYSMIRAGVNLIPVPMPSVASSMDSGILDGLEKAYTNSKLPIKALLISNPNNPIGRPWSREILEGMYRFCQSKDIHIISDEVFASVTYKAHDLPGPTPVTSLLALDFRNLGVDPWRAHVIWSPSKVFGMAGVRLVSDSACRISKESVWGRSEPVKILDES